MMCQDLTDELAQFDLQKEKELKQILLDYATAQLERHEKVSISDGWDLVAFPGYLPPMGRQSCLWHIYSLSGYAIQCALTRSQ